MHVDADGSRSSSLNENSPRSEPTCTGTAATAVARLISPRVSACVRARVFVCLCVCAWVTVDVCT